MLLMPRLRPRRRDGTGPKQSASPRGGSPSLPATALSRAPGVASIPGGSGNERGGDRGQVPGEPRHLALVAVEHVLRPRAVCPELAPPVALHAPRGEAAAELVGDDGNHVPAVGGRAGAVPADLDGAAAHR